MNYHDNNKKNITTKGIKKMFRNGVFFKKIVLFKHQIVGILKKRKTLNGKNRREWGEGNK